MNKSLVGSPCDTAQQGCNGTQQGLLPMEDVEDGPEHAAGESSLLDSLPISTIIVDESLQVAWVNRNFLEKTQRDIHRTLGSRVTTLFPGPLLDYIGLERKLRATFSTGQTFIGEPLAYRAPGLSARAYSYFITPVRAGVWRGHTLILLEDITEKMRLMEEARSAQRHLANLVEHAHDLIISTDAEGRIISWNPALERTSGYTADHMQGRLLFDLFEESQRDEVIGILRYLRARRVVSDLELDLKTRSGHRVRIAWSFSPICDENAPVTACVAVGRDLSERRTLEMQLFQSEKLAALGVMAGGIAHELRNPLTICSSAAQFLEAEIPSSASLAREGLAKITNAARRASAIIDALLRFASPSGNQVEPVNLVTIVRDTVNLIASQAGVQDVQISQNFPSSVVPVLGDTNLLQQVAMNLLLNALQAMAGGGQLTVSVLTEGDEALISLRDTGYGISDELIGRIFDPFFTTRSSGKGTGLGLAVSYAIVQQHRGRIEVASVNGEGSTFTVRLPLAHSDEH